MKVCMIGGAGHFSYVIQGVAGDKDARICGISPGSQGESMDAVRKAIARAGLIEPGEFADYREMLDKLKPDIVGVAPYFCDNALIAVESLKRGINVFVEKPAATTLDDLKAVEDAHAASGVRLSCMLSLRYDPAMFAAWQTARDGAIGAVRLLTAQKSYKLGTRPDFYKDRKSYGGTIPWVGSHGIDLLYWFSGEKFKSVWAAHSSLFNRNNGDMEITALCGFTFTNEVFGALSMDYLRPAGAPSHGDDRIRVAGAEGIIEAREGKAFLINAAKPGIQEIEPAPDADIFRDFMNEVRGEGKCRVSAEDAFSVTRACLLARQAADTGRETSF